MTCQEYREEASAWFDGETGPRTFDALVMHAHDCDSCRAFLGQIPGQSALVRRFPATLGSMPSMAAAQGGPTLYKFNAPLAVAAAIILVILTIAVQGNLQGKQEYRPEERVPLSTSAEVAR